MKETPKVQVGEKPLLTKEIGLAEVVTLTSATAFVLTVVYFSSMSISLSINLLQYFTIGDYLNQAVIWLPIICGGLLLGVPFGKFMERLDEQAGIEPSATRKPNLILIIVLSGLSIMLTMAAFLFKRSWQSTIVFYAVPLMLLWYEAVAWYYSSSRFKDRKPSRPFVMAVLLLPAAAILCFTWGLWRGFDLADPKTKIPNVVTAEGNDSGLILLLDRYALLRQQDGSIIVVKSDSIHRILSP